MARQITESIADVEAPSMLLYRGADGLGHVAVTFDPARSDGKPSQPETIDRTLAQLVTAGIITAGERTAFVATATKIRTAYRGLASLDP
jgi:hypothetical protein